MSWRFADRYYFVSLIGLLTIGIFKTAAGDANLPPLDPGVRFFINMLYLNLALAFVLFVADIPRQGLTVRLWIGWAVASLLLCLAWPVFSGDLMEYLIRGRILAVYHKNPYRHVPIEFPGDILYPYSTWKMNPDSYGPVGVWLEAIPAFFFPKSVRGMVAAQKLVYFAFMGLGAYFFQRLAKQSYGPSAGRYTALFVFSPLLIVSTMLDGHNDIVMLALTVAAVYFLLNGRYTRAFLFLTLAALMKYTALLLLPFFAVAALKNKWKEKSGFPVFFALREALLNTGVVALFFIPLWQGRGTFLALIRASSWFYTNTLPYALWRAMSVMGLPANPVWIKISLLAIFAFVYGNLLTGIWRRDTVEPKQFFRTIGLMYLCFYATITIPFGFHYLLWALPWLALSSWPMDIFLITLYSFTGLFSYFKRINYLIVIATLIYGVALFLKRRNRHAEAAAA